ncbi:MAG: hypothetical protein KBS94_04935 [Prevotella sp.]|nr:hypothetical protein [Candidatus Equicola faecalis]
MKQIQTPVLFLVFNRPEKTEQTFAAIRKAAPTKLYVAIDAPRESRPDDVENCNKVKKIVKNVDWPCETHYLIQEKNLGCTLSGKTAWDWFFQFEDRMIFVEDDGLASISAFYFVEAMLEKYKDEERIAYVGAVNYGPKFGEYSYFVSRFPSATYFMGTWKRVYRLYDYDMIGYANARKEAIYKNSFFSKKQKLLSEIIFKGYVNSVKTGHRQNTYDTQMNFLVHRNDMLTIYPNENMVKNIGLDYGANTDRRSVKDSSSVLYSELNMHDIDINSIKYMPKIEYSVMNDKVFYKERVLHNKLWIKVFLKALLLRYFSTFYNKCIKPLRRH